MRARLTAAVTAAAVIVGSSAVAMADDLNPPPWRGGPLSVYAEWDWGTAPQNWLFMPPDVFTTWSGTADPGLGPNGETLYMGFSTHAEVDVGTNWAWDPADGDGGLVPVVPGGAGIAFKVQNWEDLLPEKWLRIQVTYIDQLGFGMPTIDEVLGYEEPSPPNPAYQGMFMGGFSQPPNYWYEDWIILPNPDWDYITLHVPEGTILDQVVIDTISIPAPATAALLGIGLLAGRRRR